MSGAMLGVDAEGRICAPSSLPPSTPRTRLAGRALLPGLVNAHSHAFQRLIRGRTEHLTAGRPQDDFWTWRERMYQAASALDPEDVHVASRQAFVEMVRSGITTVGEFHYLHHAPDGTPYPDPDLLAHQVIRAAREVGLRITLLRVGYARPGFNVPESPRQRRFYDPDAQAVLLAVARLTERFQGDPGVRIGLAPHSVRAVPRAWLEAFARAPSSAPLHIHVSEQLAEVEACLSEHGMRPVELLSAVGLLSPRLTAVHAIHLAQNEVQALGAASASVCACPSTERNLGDGVVPADALLAAGVKICLGSDSQAEIDLLGEARQLEGNLRLIRGRRAVLDDGRQGAEGLSRTLLRCATESGAKSLGWQGGTLAVGTDADFMTVDLRHPSFAGFPVAEALSAVLWGAVGPGAVSDVVVGGRHLVRDGHHALEEDSARDFAALARRVFA